MPPAETLKTLQIGRALWLFAVNCVAVFLFYSAIELRLYVLRSQGNHFKYNARFPADKPSDVFWFNSQNAEGMLRTFLTGVPIWTAFEIGMLWAYGNGIGPWVGFSDHPLYLAALALLVPVYHETHFFLIHRLIHWGPLYRSVHSVHHNSVNPSPWSSLSMHPIEQLLYFSSVLLHADHSIKPRSSRSISSILRASKAPSSVHIGFDKIEIGEAAGFDSHAYAHYLHHKYFEVNYADGLVPLDEAVRHLARTWHGRRRSANERPLCAKRQARVNAMKARRRSREIRSPLPVPHGEGRAALSPSTRRRLERCTPSPLGGDFVDSPG